MQTIAPIPARSGSATKASRRRRSRRRGSPASPSSTRIGAARTELVRRLAGVDAPTSGEMLVRGKLRAFRSLRDAIGAGIALLPEERKKDGILPQRSILSNVALPRLPVLTHFGLLRRRRMRALALIYTGGNPLLGVPSTFRRLFASEIGIFPVPVVVVAVLVTFYQLLATGIIIILAMLVDRLTRGRE